MPHPRARDLERRARHLRHFANRIERAAVLALDTHAGEDTWRGARPLLCINLLRRNQAQLHAEIDALRWQAYLFDQRALELNRLHAREAGVAS